MINWQQRQILGGLLRRVSKIEQPRAPTNTISCPCLLRSRGQVPDEIGCTKSNTGLCCLPPADDGIINSL